MEKDLILVSLGNDWKCRRKKFQPKILDLCVAWEEESRSTLVIFCLTDQLSSCSLH